MAEQTTNYGLKKPSQSDLVNVQDFNENFDIIDENMGNFAILEDVGEPLEEELLRDADLLGGEPKSYFDDKITANANSINTINSNFIKVAKISQDVVLTENISETLIFDISAYGNVISTVPIISVVNANTTFLSGILVPWNDLGRVVITASVSQTYKITLIILYV